MVEKNEARKFLRPFMNLARCICRNMRKSYRIELNDLDLGQILDGLEIRAEAWERTAAYHQTGESQPDFIVEECSDAHEAEGIAKHYRSIIAKIRKQMEE